MSTKWTACPNGGKCGSSRHDASKSQYAICLRDSKSSAKRSGATLAPASMRKQRRDTTTVPGSDDYDSVAYNNLLDEAENTRDLDRLREISVHQDAFVRSLAAKNEIAPTELLDEMAEDESPTVRAAVGGNENASQRTLDLLSRGTHVRTAINVAHNPSASRETLKLIIDNNPSDNVVHAALANPSAPLSRVELASKHPNVEMRTAAAGNPELSQDSVDRLAKDASPDVREAIATHGRLSSAAAYGLTFDSDENVAMAAASSGKMTERNLRDVRARWSSNYKVLNSVASHENAPEDLLRELMNHPNGFVSNAARYQLDERRSAARA